MIGPLVIFAVSSLPLSILCFTLSELFVILWLLSRKCSLILLDCFRCLSSFSHNSLHYSYHSPFSHQTDTVSPNLNTSMASYCIQSNIQTLYGGWRCPRWRVTLWCHLLQCSLYLRWASHALFPSVPSIHWGPPGRLSTFPLASGCYDSPPTPGRVGSFYLALSFISRPLTAVSKIVHCSSCQLTHNFICSMAPTTNFSHDSRNPACVFQRIFYFF